MDILLYSNHYSSFCTSGGQEDFGRRRQQHQQLQHPGNCNYSNLHNWHEGGAAVAAVVPATRNTAVLFASNNEAPPPAYSEAIKY